VVEDSLSLSITDDDIGRRRDDDANGLGLRMIACRARLLRRTMRIE